jgi:citrate synthase
LERLDKEHHDHYHENLFEIQLLMEDYMIKNKNLYPNVDFYSASLLHVLGVPSPLFTPIFAASRAAGMVSSYLEQLRDNRILRPRLRYMGEIGKNMFN